MTKMTQTAGIFVVLSVFLSTGQALKCIQCSSYSDTDCNATATDCPSSSDACKTTLVRNRGERWTSFYLIRSCASKSDCSNNGRVMGLYTETAFSTSCCFNDSCTPSTPTFPVLNRTLNGLQCPAYVDKTMEPCNIKSMSECMGDQTYCVRYSQTTNLGSTKNTLYLGGCATRSDCATRMTSASAADISIEITRTCYNAASNLYARRVLPYSLPIILLSLKALVGSGFLLS